MPSMAGGRGGTRHAPPHPAPPPGGEQTSFEALCDALRFGAAREYLDLTDLPVSEISAALAYASPSVFAEAFRRWSGLSPTAWRRRNRQTPASPAAEAVAGPPSSRLAFRPAPD